MTNFGQHIEDVISGQPTKITRDVYGIPEGAQLLTANLQISPSLNADPWDPPIDLQINPDPQPQGQITDNGANGVGTIVFNLPATLDLQPKTGYTYRIYTAATGEDQPQLLEAGTLTPRSADDLSPTTAKHSHAEAAGEGTTRVRNLIDNYLDVILHEFRQLKVWDEHARRSANNPQLLYLTYQNLNPTVQAEVFNGQNEHLPQTHYTIDHKNGTLRVHNDTGYDDYFVTYSFNYFPAPELQSLLELTLQELNLSGGQGGAPGGFLTYYTDINTAPAYWDAALVFGAASKAFRRLAVDSGLWKNYLIWVSDNNGPNLAREYADYYQAELDSIKSQLKRIFLIARPTIAFQAFRTRGWGAMGLGSSRFRELRLNQIGMY
jgi:hypothetical protein